MLPLFWLSKTMQSVHPLARFYITPFIVTFPLHPFLNVLCFYAVYFIVFEVSSVFYFCVSDAGP